jgi:nicotinamidase-related amidase
VYRAGELLARIRALVARAHRAGAPVFFVRQVTKGALAMGSDGWQLHPGLRPAGSDIFINKERASPFRQTRLLPELQKRGITTTVIAGLAAHQCIKSTCIDAKRLGFTVILARDGHSSLNTNAARLIEHWNARLGSGTARVVPARASGSERSQTADGVSASRAWPRPRPVARVEQAWRRAPGTRPTTRARGLRRERRLSGPPLESTRLPRV